MKANTADGRVLTLFVREGCHLCEDMQVALADFQTELGFSLLRQDIAGNPELIEEYGLLIPVLKDGEREICHFFLDVAALRNHFSPAR